MWFEHQGLNTRYRLEGEGPQLVLIHGVGSSLEAWDGVVDELDAGFRTLRYDLRGLGESTKLEGPYQLADFVDDLAALLDHVGFETCHVAGHSLGGLIAQGFALAHPDRVAKLVLSAAVAGRTEEEKARVLKQLEAVESGVAGKHFRRSLARWFTPEFQQANPGLIAQLEQRNRANHPQTYAAAYRVLVENDLADELHRIKAETLITTGEGDRGSNPRMAALMHERIAGSVLRILPGLRHSTLVEAPQTMADLLREFLAEQSD